MLMNSNCFACYFQQHIEFMSVQILIRDGHFTLFHSGVVCHTGDTGRNKSFSFSCQVHVTN